MALETYRAVRSAVGADFPVLIKVNVQEDFEGGVVFDDVLRLASALAAEKADGIEISGSSWAAAPQEKGAFYLDEGAKIAESAGVKVILTGGLRSKEQMNKILNETKIEFFGLARPLMRDPAIPNKLLK
jgi:2,4-dienoyl-CoA reductase-like NADH-dependent reductase (Old Yellow Enzyme family)